MTPTVVTPGLVFEYLALELPSRAVSSQRTFRGGAQNAEAITTELNALARGMPDLPEAGLPLVLGGPLER